ncbi:MAG TPA: hypothetical protein VFJ63_04580 [Candidatus Bathyarchaeia archaeon]|nr:hypothetical protein [Candidatus Bathyarchaeia archaeon]
MIDRDFTVLIGIVHFESQSASFRGGICREWETSQQRLDSLDPLALSPSSGFQRIALEQVERVSGGVLWRIIATILTLTVFLVGTLIFVGFYTDGYTLFQKIIVFLVGFILSIATVSIIWVAWASRRGWMRGKGGPWSLQVAALAA